MPLVESGSKKAFKENIKTEAKSKPIKQAVAIAYSVQDKAKKRKNTLASAYAKHMAGTEEKVETKKESKKTEKGEM